MRPSRLKSRAPKAKTTSRSSGHWFDGMFGTLLGLLGVLIGARLLLAALAAMPAIAAVGDRIPVGPATVPAGLTAPDLNAHEVANPAAPKARACRLDLAIMKQPGGVLSVLAVRPDGVVLSWAGGPTAPGAAACDAAHQSVLVGSSDYALLLKRQSAKH